MTEINCQQLIDYCFDYLEGELPEDEQSKFRQHLGLCPDCVCFFETYRDTPKLSREALATQMPSSVKALVRAFLRDLRNDE